MPLLRVEAERLSQNQVVQGLIEEIITVDEVFQVLPFAQVSGKAYVYKRELTLPGVAYLDVDEVVPESAATFSEIVTRLRILAGDVDVDKFLLETMSDTEDQLATQIALKVKALARQFQASMINGNSGVNPKEFDGLRVLTTAGQTINAGTNGAALTLAMLDELVDAVPNKPDFLLMRSGTRRAFMTLCRNTGGGTDAVMLQSPNFTKPVLSHNGTPILLNDFMAGNETLGSGTNLCSVYAVRANEMDGVHGLYGGTAAGIRVESVGTVQNKDSVRTRVKWYVGMALKSTRSIARLAGVTNI
jgi:hypothetical protein